MSISSIILRRIGICLLLVIFSSSYATEDHLDVLFEQLRTSQTEIEARQIEDEIWRKWFQSGNPDVDALMEKAMERRRWYDFDGAIAYVDQAIKIRPDYAEAWNQRATLHFHQQKFEESLQDIARTLELEPRHFGAMAGRALIRLQQMKPTLAAQNIKQATEIHPFLKERNLLD